MKTIIKTNAEHMSRNNHLVHSNLLRGISWSRSERFTCWSTSQQRKLRSGDWEGHMNYSNDYMTIPMSSRKDIIS